jgi:hypothetical protein
MNPFTMKSNQVKAMALAGVLGLVSVPAGAATTYLTAQKAGATFNFLTSGTYGNTLTSIGNGASSFLIAIDESALTLKYDEIKIQFPQSTFSYSTTLTVGLGQTATFKTDITVNAFTLTYDASEALALTPTLNGQFTIGVPTLPAFGSLALSGSYKVTGPTQTAQGTFQTPTVPALGAANAFRWGTFDSTGYPETSSLMGGSGAAFTPTRLRWAGLGPILDTTVDGVNVSVSFFDSTAAQAVTASQIGDVALRKVPEPGVAGLGVAGMGLLVFRRRRGLV